jgi:carbamoyl-phosphate synthase small subunit
MLAADSSAPIGSPPALLVLEDGRTFRGRSFGAIGETFGEAAFVTAMSGYQETLTDPSYHRQVVIATAPHIGNTGWNDEDDESSRIWVAGYVVRDPARRPSNWRSRRSLDDELQAQGVVGMCEVDTRALTRHLRERGAMRVGLSSVETDPEALLRRVLGQPEMAGAFLADQVSTDQTYVVKAHGEPRFRVVAVDLGIKSMTPYRMAERGIEVHVVPATATILEILALRPDGVFFSNGPGDPAATDGPVDLLRAVLAARVPFFGICFGNQLFGRALGFGTYKLTYGHRGINQPVMDLTTRKVEVTAHNHGFAVDAPLQGEARTPYGLARVSHVGLNDQVVEGLELRDDDGRVLGFSVQYHPEAAAGPHDAAYLFDRFVDVMTGMRAEPVEAKAGMRAERVEAQGLRAEPVEAQPGMRAEPVEAQGLRAEPVEAQEPALRQAQGASEQTHQPALRQAQGASEQAPGASEQAQGASESES